MLFETILRHAYQIPSHEGIMLQLNDSVVVYPVSNLDVDEAGKAHKIEISTFLLPSAQSGGGMPPPISAPTPAPANPLLYNPGAVNIGNASKHVAPSLTG